MKKYKQSIIGIFIFLIIIGFSSYVFAYNEITVDWPDAGDHPTDVANIMKNIWSTTITVVQVLSVAAIVFAGLRYMFASADTRADIKKQLGYLALGAILVFSTTTVIKFVANFGNNLLLE